MSALKFSSASHLQRLVQHLSFVVPILLSWCPSRIGLHRRHLHIRLLSPVCCFYSYRFLPPRRPPTASRRLQSISRLRARQPVRRTTVVHLRSGLWARLPALHPYS